MLKKLAFLIFRLIEAAFVSLLFALCILIYRLNQGPIPIPAFKNYLIANFSFEDRGIVAEVDDLVLTLQRELNPIGVRAQGFRIRDEENGLLLLDVPEASLNFSWFALLRGEILPKEIRLFKPSVQLPTSLFKEGQLQTDAPLTLSSFSPITFFLQENHFGNFDLIKLENAKVALLEKNKRVAVFWPDLNVNISRTQSKLRLRTDILLKQGRDEKRFDIDAEYDFTKNLLSLSLAFDPFKPSTLQGVAPFLSSFTATASGKFSLDAPLPRTFTLADFLTFVQMVNSDLTLSDGFVPILYNQKRLYVNKMRLLSHFDQTNDIFYLRDFSLKSGDLILSSNGSITNVYGNADPTKKPSGVLRAVGDHISLEQLLILWPKNLGTDSREWIEENFKKATFRNLDFSFDLETTSDVFFLFPKKMDGTVSVENAALTYLEGMPLVENAFGSATFSLDSIDITLDQANTFNIQLNPGSRVYLFDLEKDVSQITIDIHGNGPLEDVLELLNAPRLKIADDISVRPEQVSGISDAHLVLNLPLIEDVSEKDLKIKVTATATDASFIRAFDLPYSFSEGFVTLTLSEDGLLDLRAEAIMEESIPVSVFLHHKLFSSPRKTEAEIFAFMDPSDLALFDLQFLTVSDPVSVFMSVLLDHDNDTLKLSLYSDLTDHALRIPFPLFSKAAGVPSSLIVTFETDRLDRHTGLISFAAEDKIILEGRYGFGQNSVLEWLTLSTLYPSARFNFYTDARGVLTLVLSGQSFKMDLLSTLDYLSHFRFDQPESLAAQNRSSQVFVKFDTLYLADGAKPFHDVSAVLFFENGILDDGDLTASFDGERLLLPFRKQEDGTVAFNADIQNISGILSRIGILNFVVSGDLKFSGRIYQTGNIRGAISARNITMKNPPLMVSILSKAALSALVRTLTGDAVPFEMGALYTYHDSLIAVQKSYLRGAGMGMIQTGFINLRDDRLNFRGSVIPAYSINSLPGRIPLLGLFFSGGEEGGGLFAFTYRAKGPIKNPEISINPFSFFAPGIFRGLFLGNDPLDRIVFPEDSDIPIIIDPETAE